MSQPPKNAKDIFLEALNAEPADRAALLDVECAENAALRRQVEALLKVHDEPDSLLDSPRIDLGISDVACQDATLGQPIVEQPGDTIGPYKLAQRIGEGGMGVVYMAEQSEPVQRRVALKIIKPGMDTQQVIARFEAELQALAAMDHPNIAKVLDGGTTDSGRPYFVMELVSGIPITEFCNQQHLDVPHRLELFADVCHAVQHAHQKGTIHRDIKPSNILVTLYDGHPVPKVIDFGVAKAIRQTLTEKTIFTQLGQIVGTLEYMSPEQADPNRDIDTRSDIYSLGVLLYELLTGETPFERQRLRSAAFDEIMRVIREEEPPRPSQRLSSSHSLPAVAASRQTEPKKLSTLVHGELDWIVMKALEKDRARRYETANGLAADVGRYLSDEPVEAGPPSKRYRFSKFVRRNKRAIVLSGTVAVALVIGLVGTAWQASRATRAEQTALAEAARADREAKTAMQKAAEADAVVDFLVNDLLGSAAPEEALGRKMTVEEVLAAATKKINTAFTDQPVVEASVRHTLGSTYQQLGRFEEGELQLTWASELLTAHLGPEHEDTITTTNDLVDVFSGQGKFAEAQELGEETLAISRRVLGPEHPLTLSTTINLAGVFHAQGKYAEAQELYEETLAISRRVLGPEHSNTLMATNNLAGVFFDQGKLAEAQELFEETLAINRRVLGPEHPDTLVATNNLAHVFDKQGKSAEAQELYEETLAIKRRVLGPEHPGTLTTMNNLAGVFSDQRKLVEAQELYEEMLAISRRVLGLEHPNTLMATTNLAGVFWRQGKNAEAQELYEETLAIQRRVLGPEHPSTLVTLRDMVYQVNHLSMAKKHCDEVLELDLDNYGKPYIASVYVARGRFSWLLEEYDHALADFEKAAQINPNDAWAKYWLCWALATCPKMETRDVQRAIEMGEASVKLSPPKYDPWVAMGAAHYVAGDHGAAVSALNKGLEFRTGSHHSWAGFYLAMIHWQLDQKKEALQWYEKATDGMSAERPFYQAELGRLRDQAAELLGIDIKDEDTTSPPAMRNDE